MKEMTTVADANKNTKARQAKTPMSATKKAHTVEVNGREIEVAYRTLRKGKR